MLRPLVATEAQSIEHDCSPVRRLGERRRSLCVGGRGHRRVSDRWRAHRSLAVSYLFASEYDAQQ